ncbi:MAG: hypothetical protein FJW54_01735 [Actinobacteria bacterium]|nr:hypothetical protein [Actinomycetota bacterium]
MSVSQRLGKKLSALALILLAIALSGCSTSSDTSGASAESSDSPVGYRYWGYSQSSEDGRTWITAMEGPATTDPQDGTVEGWNYTLSAEGVVDPQPPALAPDFQTLCGATAEKDGAKRIGYVIEFGNSAIHPEGDIAPTALQGCASVPVDASGIDVLNAVTEVRAGEGGFICGLAGFPSKDCGADPIPVPESMRE